MNIEILLDASWICLSRYRFAIYRLVRYRCRFLPIKLFFGLQDFCLEDVFSVRISCIPKRLDDVLKMSSIRLGRRKIVTVKPS